jgi:hypothetical protein
MSIEIRYVHTTSSGSWRLFNYNEVNIVENGFLDEFKMAQANLVANNAERATRSPTPGRPERSRCRSCSDG